MTEYLGDAVLNLTGDLGDLARREQEALVMTARNMDLMAREVDKFVARSAQAGQLFDRSFVQPVLLGLDHLDLKAIEAASSVDVLAESFRSADRALEQFAATVTGDADAIKRAVEGIAASMERSAAAVIAAAAEEERAIDDLRNAYLELAAAEHKAAEEAGRLKMSFGAEVGALPPVRVPNLAEGGGASSAWSFSGARGPYGIGSIQNPMVLVLEAGQFGNLAGRGAAIAMQAGAGQNQPQAGISHADWQQFMSLVLDAVGDRSTLGPGAAAAMGNTMRQLPQRTGPSALGFEQPTVIRDPITGQFAPITPRYVAPHQAYGTSLYEPNFEMFARDLVPYMADAFSRATEMQRTELLSYLTREAASRPALPPGGPEQLLLGMGRQFGYDQTRPVAGLLEAAAASQRPTATPADFRSTFLGGPAGAGEQTVRLDAMQYAGFMDPKSRGIADLLAGLAAIRNEEAKQVAEDAVIVEEINRLAAAGGSAPFIGPFSQQQTKNILAALGHPAGAGGIPAAAAGGAGAGAGGGGNTFMGLPLPADAGGGGGGGGGGGIGAILMALLWGHGHAGMLGRGGFGLGIPILGAGFGSLGSFAGLGPEHLLMTGLGIAGSAVTAGAGAGVLAAGAAGQLAVGAGSNAAVMSSTIRDTRTLSQSITQLQTAQANQAAAQTLYNQTVAKYGQNSKQATNAQNQLTSATNSANTAQQNYNQTIQSLGGMTAGVQAELQLAKQTQALNTFWDKASSGARVAAVSILSQVVTLGHDFVPLVTRAAQQNLTIISNDIKPLFAWLEGPQGLQIWNTLENNFRNTLPTSIDAFTNSFEAVLRMISIASNYTGGFMTWLDKLSRELNGMSNIQFQSVIGRLVDDFRVWEHFVKALSTDLYLLFTQDAATGRNIIVTLTGMLDKLGQWERSVQGRSELHTIFSVHLQEVLALLRILPLFVNAVSPIYLTLAPALTKAFTAVASGILDVVQALEKIPGGTWLVGLGLIAAKLGQLGAVVGGLRTLLLGPMVARGAVAAGGAALAGQTAAAAAGGGVGAGAAGAAGGLLGRVASSGVGRAIGGGIETGTLAVATAAESAGFAGLAGAITTAGAAVAPVAAGLLPLLAAAGGVYGLVKLMELFHGPTPKVPTGVITPTQQTVPGINTQFGQTLQQPGGLPQVLASTGPAGTVNAASARAYAATGPQRFSMQDIASTHQAKLALEEWVKTASSATAVSHMNVLQLEAMRNEGDALAKIFPQYASTIDRGLKGIHASLVPLRDLWATILGRWQSDTSKHLPAIFDLFNSNTRLIASVVGLNSAQGRQAMATNVQHMVNDTQIGMLENVISVKDGMHAVNMAIKQGVTDGALTWKQGLTDQLQTLAVLYGAHKISTKKLMGDLSGIYSSGFHNIRADTQATNKAMWDYLQNQEQQGNLTHQAAMNKWHAYQLTANARAASDMSKFAGSIINAVGSAAGASNQAMIAIAQATDSVLKSLGVTTIPIPALVHAQQLQNLFGQGKTGVAGVLSGSQTGGIVQFGRQGEKGFDSILANFGGQLIKVAPGEQGLVITGAQQQLLNDRLADMGGLPGMFDRVNQPHAMASGGYVNPLPPGARIGRTDQGVDASMPVGAPIGPIGAARIIGQQSNWFAGQPMMWWQLTSGPDAGRYVYLAEQITPLVSPGQTVSAGQAVARYAPRGTGIEMGWATGSGATLARSTSGYTEGQITAAGASFRAFLAGLSHGVAIALGPGAGGLGQVPVPQIKGHGLLAEMVRSTAGMVTRDANAYIMQRAGSVAPGVGSFTGGATAPVGNIMQIAQRAFAAAGLPFVSYIVTQLLSKESSGGRNEPPSGPLNATGPFQVTPPTFAQYDPGGNIGVPYDNALAAARYILSRYHSLPQMAQTTGLFTSGYHGYHSGGMVPFAGAFGGGGAVTASQPTMAMFGDHGAETAVFIPHAQSGMLAGRPVTGHTKAGTPYSGNGSSRMYYYPGRGWITGTQVDQLLGHTPTPTHSSTHATTGTQATLKDVVELLGLVVGAIHETRATLERQGLPGGGAVNIITGLGGVTQQGMTQIAGVLNTYLNKATPDQAYRLAINYANKVFGGPAGRHEHPSSGGAGLLARIARDGGIGLAGLGVNSVALLSQSGSPQQRQIENILIRHALAGIAGQFTTQQTAAQNRQQLIGLLGGLPAGTRLDITALQAKSMGLTLGQARSMVGQSPDAFRAQANALTGVLAGYHQDAHRLQALYKDALKTHNKKLQASLLAELDTVTQAQVQATSDLATAQQNAIQAAAQEQIDRVTAVINQNTKTTGAYSAGNTALQTIIGLASGTDLSSLGLNIQTLSQVGIPLAQGLTGGGMSTAAMQSLNATLASQQQADIQALNQLQAMIAGGLSGDALTQAQSGVQQLITSILGLSQQMQSNQAAVEQNTVQLGQQAASAQQNAYGILGQIQGLPPGSNLAALGLTPEILAQIGLSPGTATGLEGTGLSYLQGVQQQQGGILTGAQIAGAQAGVTYQNQLLAGQQQTDIGTLNQLEAQLPGLSGAGLTQAQNDIQTLVAAILTLSGEMQSNTTAVSQLTSATNANTTATGQMTGQVTFSYQGQNWLASAVPMNVGVGV